MPVLLHARRRPGTPPGAAIRRPVAASLALVWAAVAAVLAAWLLLGRPAAPEHLAAGTTLDFVLGQRPGHVMSTWVFWDAPRGHDGWVILEGRDAWPPSAEPLWRRRVHPGWNLLTWSDATAVPPGGLRLRVLHGAPRAWASTPLETAAGHGIRHVAGLAGLVMALLLAIGVGTALAARALARAGWTALRPGWWGAGVGAATVLGAGLRAHTLTDQGLWLDEVLTAIGAQDLTWVLYAPQIFGHPPVQYLAGWLAGGRGIDEAWLRAPFLVAGVATIPAVAWLGRTLFGRGPGLLAALALAIAPFHIDVSQTARPYAPLLLLGTVALLALAAAIAGGRPGPWLLFSATAVLVFYTQYAGAVIIAAAAVTALLLLPGRPREQWAAAGIAFTGIGLLLVPWLPVAARLASAQIGHGELPAAALARLVLDVFLPQYLGGVTGRSVALLLIGGAFLSLGRARVSAVMAGWLVLPVVAVWLAQPGHFVAGRHLAFLMVPLVLLLGLGAWRLAAALGALAARAAALGPWRPPAARAPAPGRWVGRATPRPAAAALALALLLAWAIPCSEALRHHYASRRGFDWRVVADVLAATIPDGHAVLATIGAAYPLRHYWRHDIEVLERATYRVQLATVLRTSGGAPGGAAPSSRGSRSGARWPARSVPGPPVWVVTHEGWDRPVELGAWLEANAVPVVEVPPSWSLPGVRVWRLRAL